MPAGMYDSIPNADFSVPVNQGIKVAAHAAGSSRAANARAHQTVNHINQSETSDNNISNLSLIGEPFAECSNLPNMSAQDDINQQIPHGKPSQAENIGVSSFSLVHGPLHASINVANTVQVAKLPTSNTNPMPTEMESFGGVTDVERDSYTNNKKFVEYPMRQLP